MIRALVFVWFSTLALAVSPQTLQPITAPAGSGLPWWVVGFAVAGVILVAGFIWLRIKKPTAAAAVQSTVSDDLAAAMHRLAGAVEGRLAPTITTTAPPDLQPALNLANGKLAQIKAILDA